VQQHYRTTKIQALSVIDDWGLDFATGNVIKYLQRCPHKGTANADSIKALWYMAYAATKDTDFADRIAREAEEINGHQRDC
jgi:siroheme synthase (precorrin-2 oxidase/ferrochelatase)